MFNSFLIQQQMRLNQWIKFNKITILDFIDQQWQLELIEWKLYWDFYQSIIFWLHLTIDKKIWLIQEK